jgi:hypothetical protein
MFKDVMSNETDDAVKEEPIDELEADEDST